MSISYWLDHSPAEKLVKDVVIIGGGLAGLSTAYWLSQEDPSLKILLIEKDRLGFGASGRNAGFITCGSVEHFNRMVEKHGKDEANEIWKFSEKNLQLLKDHIIKEQGPDIWFSQSGSFSLASSENEFQELKKSARLMESLGIPVETLEENELRRRLGVENLIGGVKYVDDAHVHPHRLIKLLEKSALAAGSLEIREQTEVFRVDTDSRTENKIVLTDRFQVECQSVIHSTNAYMSLLLPLFKDKIFPTRGQILTTAPVRPFMEGPCYANFVLDYFRQLPTGEVLIGGFRQLEKETEVGWSDHTTDKIQEALNEFLQHYIPRLKGVPITHRWAGIMGFSFDGQPMVGSLPTDPQTFFVGGFTGHGLGLAFHSAKVLVDLIYGREIPKFISAKRF